MIDFLNKQPNWLWLLLVVVLSTIVKLIDITQVSLWIDEAYSLLVANGHPYPLALTRHPVSIETMYQAYLAWQPLQWDQLIAILKQNVHMPLYYLLLNPWLGMFGNNEFGLRSFSTCSSALTLIPFYFLALGIGSINTTPERARSIARWGTLFMAFVPMQLYFAQEGRMYALSMFWAVTSAWLLWVNIQACQQVYQGEQPSFIKRLCLILAYTLSLLAGIFSHYMFLFYVVFHAVYFVATVIFKPSQRYWLFVIPVIACGGLLYSWYPIYEIQQQGVWDNYHFAKGFMKPLRYINKFFLMPMESFAHNNIIARIFYFPLAAAMFVGYFVMRIQAQLAAAKNDPEAIENPLRLNVEGFLLFWLLVPMVLQCGYDIFKQTHTSIITRYLLLVTPVMPLIAGLCMDRFKRHFATIYQNVSVPLVSLVLIVALASVVHHSPANMHSHKKQINNAAEYLASHLKPGDLIFTNGPLGAPNLLVFYLMKTHPKQSIVYWVKDYNGKMTPLPKSDTINRYRRVWFFANRSNERRGLNSAQAFVQRYYPVKHESVDPQHQLDLFTRS